MSPRAEAESLRKGRPTKGHQRVQEASVVVPKTVRRMELIQRQMVAGEPQKVAVMVVQEVALIAVA